MSDKPLLPCPNCGCDDSIEGHAIANAVIAERDACARAAESAQLPKDFQWGHDAMEQFNFGKTRAATAIRARQPRSKKS